MLPFKVTDSITRDIERFAEVARRFDVIGAFPRTWAGRVRRDLESEAIGSSVALEGVRVTIEEVRRILAGDTPGPVSDEAASLVLGYQEAMHFVLRRADDVDFAWSPEIFRTIHASVMAGSWVARAGLYRDRAVWVSDGTSERVIYTPPASEQVAGLVEQLAHWLENETGSLHPLVVAAVVHAWLAAVHPFRDGNGRTARISASLVMYRNGYRLPQFTSLEEWWGAHPKDYYGAFDCLGDSWNLDADITPFVQAHVRAQRRQAVALSLRHTTERLLWTALEDVVMHELQMNSRAANALWEAFFGREITNRYYRGIADVPQVTASQDLKQLQTAGMLTALGAGRGRTYVGGLVLFRRVVDLFDLKVDASGDAPPDVGLRSAIIRALAEKARCA